MATTAKDRHCCCPTCRGLVTLDRPVFGAGQILTAADLAGLQDYVRAKNRLHTRYLHGWGVVCGLEVLCDDCEGSVTIKPGYAIDPCGSDIVVARDTRFDLIAAIRACATQARSKTGDCDPWMPPPDPGCADLESHWCIALKYREVETAYTPGLATGRAAPAAAPASSCGCGGGGGCGGSGGGGCGCGGGCSTPAPAPASAPLSRSSNIACTPRRVMECFDITAVESKEGCTPSFKIKDEAGTDKVTAILDVYVPKGTLARKIYDCILSDIKALGNRLTEQDQQILGQLLSSSPAELQAKGVAPATIHAALCRFKAAVMDMLANDDHPVRCQLRRTAGEIVLTAPGDATTPGTAAPAGQVNPYYQEAKDKFADLLAILLQLVLDCICHAFIPQCDDDPCDDRVEIACVTVKGGKILRICNHSCRRYAGAFPSTFYWMSLVPVLPLIGKLLALLCCQPDLVRKNSPLVNDLLPLLDRVDPSGSLRTTLTANSFALPRLYLSRAAETGASPLLATIAKRFDIASATVAHTGSDAEQAAAALKASGVSVEMASSEAGEETALKADMRKRALLRPGDRAKIYARDGKVVAVVREEDASEVASLRRDLEEMRGKIAALGRAPAKSAR